MPKGSIDRLNDTLDQIALLKTHYGSAFPAINTNWLRESLFNVLMNDPYLDRNEVSEDISLGGGGGWGFIKFSASRTLRHLKRLVLLTHRILGYHSSAQTRTYKSSVQGLNETQTLGELRLQVVRGIQLQKDSMQDWMIKTLGSDAGKLRHYYNQGDDARLSKVDFTEHGWCLGLSTQWLRFQATGQGDQFWAWMLTMEGEAAIRFVMAAQEVRTHLQQDVENRAAFALRRFGMRREASLVSEGPNATPLAMARNICAANHPPFSLIGQYYKGGGGHAMAARIQNGGVLFVDPNAGEVYLPSYFALESWLPKYIRRIGYDFTQHWVERYSYDPNLVRQDQPKPQSLEDVLRNAMALRRSGMGYED
jgi:hypothetical protein